MMRYTIRPAKPEDAEGLTRVHVRSWQSSYRGLLAQEFLDTIDSIERLALWRRTLAVLEEAKGLGVGRALFQEGLQWLREHGLWPMALWVLKENTRARRFYKRMGGQLAGEQSITIGDARYPEVAYGWGQEA